MYLLYVDASGAADLSDVNTRHYVLVGLCVHEGTWFALDKRLNGLTSAYCQHGDYSTEATIFNQFRDYRKKGHPWGRMRHVIDVPFFAPSERVCGLQLVDIC